MTDQELKQYCRAVTVPDREIMDAARRRQAELAKPPGSLGKLEDYSIRLAGITGQVRPHIEKCRVMAGSLAMLPVERRTFRSSTPGMGRSVSMPMSATTTSLPK